MNNKGDHCKNTLVKRCQTLLQQLTSTALEPSDSASANATLKSLTELADYLDEATLTMQPRSIVKQKLLVSIHQDPSYIGFIERLTAFFDLPSAVVRNTLNEIASVPANPWQAFGFAGIYLLHFDGGPKLANADCGLIFLEAGATFPAHRHKGEELAFVLQGRFLESSGQSFSPGDIIIRTAGSAHSFQATKDSPAVLAVIVNNGISFES